MVALIDHIKDLGPTRQAQNSLREWVDSKTPHPQLQSGASTEIETVAHALAPREASVKGRKHHGQALAAEIDKLLAQGTS